MSNFHQKCTLLLILNILLFIACSSEPSNSAIDNSLEPDVVTILTKEASNVTPITARLNGEVTSTGKVDDKGFYLSTNEIPSIDDQVVNLGAGAGTFSTLYEFPTQGETVYFRTFAINGNSISTGDISMVKYFSQNPIININFPDSESTFELGDMFDITGNVTDEDGTVKSIKIFIDDMLISEQIVSEAAYAFSESVNTDDLDLGIHEISIIATDNFQDSSTSSIEILVIEPINSIENGLVAYYPFDGNADDETVFANNGIVNNANLAPDRFGETNSAYSFTDFDSHILVPSTEQNDVGNGDFTISVWFSSLSEGVIWGKRDVDICGPNLNEETVLGFKYNGGSFEDYSYFSTSTSGSSYGYTLLPANATFLEWHKFTVVREGRMLSWFFDDKPKVTIEMLPDIDFTTTNDLFIGSDLLCQQNSNFKGYIDEFRIYNRALTEEEVSQL